MPDVTNDPFGGWKEARQTYLLACLLTGNEESASKVLLESVGEVSSHPEGSEPAKKSRLLLAAVRRRALRAPSGNELPPVLAELRQHAEPGRSLVLLDELGLLSGDEAAALLGMNPVAAQTAAAALREAIPDPSALRQELDALAPSPSPECSTALEKLAREGGVSKAKNPAMWAVIVALVLLAGLVAWQLTGRAGVFPDEALKILETARKSGPESFSPVEIKAGALPDWFAMQGIDGLSIPPALSGLDAVGVRVFQHEGETIAQMAILDQERRLYLIAFPAAPFGIHGLPANGWQTATTGRFVSAITERDGMCLAITFRGNEKDMKTFLDSLGRKNL